MLKRKEMRSSVTRAVGACIVLLASVSHDGVASASSLRGAGGWARSLQQLNRVAGEPSVAASEVDVNPVEAEVGAEDTAPGPGA